MRKALLVRGFRLPRSKNDSQRVTSFRVFGETAVREHCRSTALDFDVTCIEGDWFVGSRISTPHGGARRQEPGAVICFSSIRTSASTHRRLPWPATTSAGEGAARAI